MGSTLLELCRATHEELERAQKEIVTELDANPRTYKEGALQNNKIAKYLEKITASAKKLSTLYEDADGFESLEALDNIHRSRKEEIASLGGQGPAVFNSFYERFRELKDHHRRFPKTFAEHPEEHVYLTDEEGMLFRIALTNTALPPFTGEENYGKCLDLHEHFIVYKNLKSGDNTADYVTYIENRFFNFHDNLEQKDNDYKKYLDSLWNYLVDFIRRSQPLFEVDAFVNELDQQFEVIWPSFGGWDKPRGTLEDIDDEIPSSDAREKAKAKELQPDTIFCDACQKSFKHSVYAAHLKGKKHLKAEEKRNSLNIKAFKEIYHLEYRISETATKLLKEQIANTKTNIEKKQARTLKEWLEEQEEEEEEVVAAVEEEVESEDETQIKTTIDNYPIGWDGKPIPYWLYKLHGLGVEYKCEICGNTSYWGRKAYEKHFQEWRHAHGMRCLGIPNTKHFHDVTKINDALALWEKIKRDSSVQTWKPDNEEEFEDKEGNVFNKKTFEDLKRQGLL